MDEIEKGELFKILAKIRGGERSRDYLNNRGNFTDEQLQSLYNAWNMLDDVDKEKLEFNLEGTEKPTKAASRLTIYENIKTNKEQQKRFAFAVLVPLFKKFITPTEFYDAYFVQPVQAKIGKILGPQRVAEIIPADQDEEVAEIIPAHVEETPFYQALIPSFSQEAAATFVKKLSYYSTNNPIVYILCCLFVAFLNILHILFDINELRDAVLPEEYRWSSELVKKIENFFKIIRILLKYLYSWIKCDSIVSCLRKFLILLFICYYPPGSWMISIFCKFILCFTGVDIKLKLEILANEVYYAGVDITNFFCAIKSAFESLNINTQELTNVAKTMAPAIKDAAEAVVTSGQLVASTGQQLAITGQQLIITNEILANTISAAKNDFVTALIEFKGQLVPLLAAAGVGATCQIPDSLKTYLVEEGKKTFTSISELRDQVQVISGRVQELGDSQIDLEEIRSEMIRLGYSTPSSFDLALESIKNFAGNSAVQILLSSEPLQRMFLNRPPQTAIEYGGRKTRKYRKNYKNYKNKTKIHRKKQTHKRYRKKTKKGKKSKKY
jgi:hypothetical protein